MKKIILVLLFSLAGPLFAQSSAEIIVSAKVLAYAQIGLDVIESETCGATDRLLFIPKMKTNARHFPLTEIRLKRESRDLYYIDGQLLSVEASVKISLQKMTELMIIRAGDELEFQGNLLFTTNL